MISLKQYPDNSITRINKSKTTIKNNSTLKPRLAAALITGILFITVLLSALSYLPTTSAPEIRMSLLGERVREVSYDETANYTINVRNVDEDSISLPLTLAEVPQHWHASLDKDYLTLPGNSQHRVTLSVTAPPVSAAGIRGLDTVADISIRGGNVTIGTITLLRDSTATVKRNGTVRDLGSEEDILSGDIVNASGDAILTIDPSKLITGGNTYEGDIYVALHDAEVGFLKSEDTAYMVIMSGEVSVWVPGAGAAGVRGSSDSSLSVNLSENEDLKEEFQGNEINAVVEFNAPPVEDFLFTLAVTEEGAMVEVFEGDIGVTTDEESIVLEKYEQVTARKTEDIPEPERVQAIMLEIETDGTTEELIEVRGENIYEVDDAFAMPDMGGRSIYIIHTDEYETPHITVIQTGTTGKGEYRTKYTSIDETSTRSFDFNTTSTAGVQDIISISEDMITLDSEDEEKTYDLSIAYREKGEEEEIFTLTDIGTSEEEQVIEVEDWDNLTAGTAESVSFTEGETTVHVNDGDTGEDLEEIVAAIKRNDIVYIPWLLIGLGSMGLVFAIFLATMKVSPRERGRFIRLFEIPLRQRYGRDTLDDYYEKQKILGYVGNREEIQYRMHPINTMADILGIYRGKTVRLIEELIIGGEMSESKELDGSKYLVSHEMPDIKMQEDELELWQYIYENGGKTLEEICECGAGDLYPKQIRKIVLRLKKVGMIVSQEEGDKVVHWAPKSRNSFDGVSDEEEYVESEEDGEEGEMEEEEEEALVHLAPLLPLDDEYVEEEEEEELESEELPEKGIEETDESAKEADEIAKHLAEMESEELPEEGIVETDETAEELEDIENEELPEEGTEEIDVAVKEIDEEMESEELPEEGTEETVEIAKELEDIESEELPEEGTGEPDETAEEPEYIESEELTEEGTEETDETAEELEDIESEELPEEETEETDEDVSVTPFIAFEVQRKGLESWYSEWEKDMDGLF